MKIIQSLWSRPFLKNNDDPIIGRFNGGWLNYELNFLSWTLSCLTLIKNYKHVVLYTDKVGKEILIDLLKLPYSKCIVALDDINDYDDNLWALGKLYTYYLQKEPFLHVDGDFYIWNKFPDRIMHSELIAQSKENNVEFYQKFINEALQNLSNIPFEIIKYSTLETNIGGSNAGIIGGKNIEFLHNYATQAIDFVDTNKDNLEKINKSNFNIFYEQYLFKCMAKSQNVNISYLINNVSENFQELTRFQSHPNDHKYIHMVGYAKKQSILSEQMLIRLKMEFPVYYSRTCNLIKSKHVK
jgi:Family of unknown function (DUF6734)